MRFKAGDKVVRARDINIEGQYSAGNGSVCTVTRAYREGTIDKLELDGQPSWHAQYYELAPTECSVKMFPPKYMWVSSDKARYDSVESASEHLTRTCQPGAKYELIEVRSLGDYEVHKAVRPIPVAQPGATQA